jgi:hypothetical protein
MGLLDDAIREHLELKRRRGADPEEVARQEDEALGDPRSGEFARPGAERAEEPAAEEPLAVPVEEDLPPGPPEPAAYEPEPPPEEPWIDDEEPEESVAGQPTAEFAPNEVEPEPDVVRPDEEVDELEETPDFLQETPEHDRLWFEQKPPRDFDFDK